MGSFLMHIGISEKVRKKLNLSNKFIYGSILPDLIKMETGDRNGTHFIKTVIKDDKTIKIPMIDCAIETLNGKLNNEVRLGYIAHLVEDLIWFEKYIPSIADHVETDKIVYLKDNSVHLDKEFSVDIYDDYIKMNSYIMQEYLDNNEKIFVDLKKIMKENEVGYLEKNINTLGVQAINEMRVITKEKLDAYMKETEEKVEKIIKELLGE